MDFFVLEPIAEIGVERIEYSQPSIVNNPVCLGRPAGVFMDLRQAAGKS